MKIFKKSPDEPIIYSTEDRFGREGFAVALAESLVKVPSSQSITVGLYGTWGSGKTSIINLAIEHLSKKYKDEVVIIKFNPWVFSSAEALHMAFFATLANKLGKKLRTNGQIIAAELQRYGEVTGSVGDAVGLFFPPAKLIGKIIGPVLKRFGAIHGGEAINVDATRDRLDKLLADSNQRVVVVIDDIDRLDSDEIHQVFKLVKNIAHFSNISYLLSFDQVVVAEALAQRYPTNPEVGGSFIDKIVQLPLYVPGVSQELLNNYLLEDLNKIIEGRKFEISEDDMSRFQTVYFSRDAERLFTTPRKIIRYLNTIDFSIERLTNEASFTDVALVDLMRNFYPDLYHRVANNKELILGKGLYGDRDENQKMKARQRIFGADEPLGLERTLIKELFPSFEWALGGPMYEGDFITGWEDAKRVCTSKYFSRYFSYGIPPGDVADGQIDEYLSLIADPKITVQSSVRAFNTLIKKADLPLIISKLRRKEDDLPQQESRNLALTLVKIGDSLPRPKQALAGDLMSPYVQASVLAVRLTRNIENPFKLLKQFISDAPVNYAAEIFRWIRVNSEKGKNDGEDFVPLLNPDEIKTLGELTAHRIKSYAGSHFISEDLLLDVAHLMWIWQKWGSKDDIEKYFEKSLEGKPKRAIVFLMSYASDSYNMSTGRKTRSDFRREAYDAIAAVVDPEIFVQPLVKLYGAEVETDKFPNVHFDTDKSYELQVAQQFLYIHRHMDKKEAAETPEIIEGEIVG